MPKNCFSIFWNGTLLRAAHCTIAAHIFYHQKAYVCYFIHLNAYIVHFFLTIVPLRLSVSFVFGCVEACVLHGFYRYCGVKTSLLYVYVTNLCLHIYEHMPDIEKYTTDHCRKFGNMIRKSGKLTMVCASLCACVNALRWAGQLISERKKCTGYEQLDNMN